MRTWSWGPGTPDPAWFNVGGFFTLLMPEACGHEGSGTGGPLGKVLGLMGTDRGKKYLLPSRLVRDWTSQT